MLLKDIILVYRARFTRSIHTKQRLQRWFSWHNTQTTVLWSINKL